jgi:serine/threonine protein kinase/CRP-like cAMP-binding protein
MVPKEPPQIKLIYTAIKANLLFANCFEEELIEMVDAFECVQVPKGMTVIQQGDGGEHFYVVEKGELEVFVKAEGKKQGVKIEDFSIRGGNSFGELALMYKKPRAATVVAKENTTLWCLSRTEHHLINTYFKMYRMVENLALIGNVVIQGKSLASILTEQELEHVAMSLEHETYNKGDIISREGVGGDTLFILHEGRIDIHKLEDPEEEAQAIGSSQAKSLNKRPTLSKMVSTRVAGVVDKMKKENGGSPFGRKRQVELERNNSSDTNSLESVGKMKKSLKRGQYFGEKALISEDVRDFSAVAGIDETHVLTLDRDAIQDMLGSIEDLISGKHLLDNEDNEDDSMYAAVGERHHLDMQREDIDLITVLGAGAFGKVILCKKKDDNTKTYALKCQSKSMIVGTGLSEHVMNEIHIMVAFDHPFIATLHTVFQDKSYLYFVLELLQGGELFTHTRKFFKLEESWAKFYSASVVLAYTQIHAHHVAYRDLKPENLVLNGKGYAKIVDFGLAKVVRSGQTWTICGTPDYLAPEIITTEGHGMAVDYWALGVLIFELASGKAPFQAADPMETYEKILSGVLTPPSHFSRGVTDLCRKLMQLNQVKRLGNTKGGIHSIMTHKWYSGYDWEGLYQQRLPVKNIPILPHVDNPEDASAFEPWDPSMPMDAPETDWDPILPDMFMHHTKRDMVKKENEQRKADAAAVAK